MAKILFIWELGEGNGHILPYVELIKQLVVDGHEVHYALRTLHKAYDIFNGSGVIWHQAPFVLPRHVEIMLPVDSYAKILHHAGHDSPTRLAGLIIAWQNLYRLIDPDLMVFDYSPTALLAARSHRAKTIVVGTGFEIPPKAYPIQSVASSLETIGKEKEVLAFENKVYATIDEALKLTNMDPLSKFTDVLDADEVILRTLPELDHYSARKNAYYAGIMKSPKGELPQWPKYPGPKIFAYLKEFNTLPALLKVLNKNKYPTLIYGDKLPRKIIQEMTSETLKFVEKPLDMGAIGQSADLAICNAGHGTVAELLLSGVPMLLLPLNGEQTLTGSNVERLGVGLSAPNLHPLGMEEKLNTLLTEARFKQAAQAFADAQAFAESYKGSDMCNLTLRLRDKINNLLM